MYLAKTDKWYLERVIFLVVGILILLSLTLAYFISKYWLVLTAIIGFGLILFSLTGFCTMANILVKFGFKSNACNCGDDCTCKD